MHHNAEINGAKHRDDEASGPSQAEGNGQVDDTTTKEDEKGTVTQKTDSGVYLAMMLSEYLDRTAHDNKNTHIEHDAAEAKDAAQEGGNRLGQFENQHADASPKDSNHASDNNNNNNNNDSNNNSNNSTTAAETVTELSNLIW